MNRIERITEKSQIDPVQYDEFDAITTVLGHVSGPFSVLMHRPGLAQKVMEAGAQIRTRSTLTMGEHEVIILTVAREKDGVHEWSAHVGLARKNGVPESTIDVVRNKGELAELPTDESDIVAYTRELLRTNRVSDATYHTLVKRKGVRGVVELTATIGQYQYIAAINSAFQVGPAPGAEILPV
jgi:4-carboxymuconolactone decarboxylase